MTFEIGKTVHSVEGVPGKVTRVVHATGPEDEDEYEVDWSDGYDDHGTAHPESTFREGQF